MLIKDYAICIRVIDYSETSQIVTFFTKTAGKISAIAKGSRRRKSAFNGSIEVFSTGTIVFIQSTDGNLATLTEFAQESRFTNLVKNLFALNCSLFAVELINGLTDEYDPHPQLFDSFFQFLQDIQNVSSVQPSNRPIILSFLILFQLSLLREIGLQPVLSHCVNCKTSHEQRATSNELYFSSSAHGLICRDCEPGFPDRISLTIKAANCLNNLKLLADADEKTLNEIEKVLVYHFTEILHHPPKMAKHILNLS